MPVLYEILDLILHSKLQNSNSFRFHFHKHMHIDILFMYIYILYSQPTIYLQFSFTALN